MPNAKELIGMYDRLDKSTERENLKVIWQEIGDYILPRKNQVTSKDAKGSRRTEKLFDSTAPHSAELLAATLQGALTSNSVFWFNVRSGNELINTSSDAREWLDEATRRMYKAFNDSNFRIEIYEMFLDLVTVGTGCLTIEEKAITKKGFNGFVFKSYFVGSEFVIAEDYEGMVDTVMRKVVLTARQAHQKFGDKAGRRVLEALAKEPHEEFEYIHVVMPITEYGEGGFGNSEWKYTDIYLSVADEFISQKKGYFEFPYIVPRWAKASGEMYGRSPSFTALPDIRSLNALGTHMLQSLANDVNPSRLVPENLGVNISNAPGQLIAVPTHMIDPIKNGVLRSEARWDVSESREQRLITSIKEAYFTDQIQLQKQAQMTATESTIIFELMQRLLGPVFGRSEVQIGPVVENAFNIMLRTGGFPEVPEELQGQDIDIQFVGPLARSQRMGEVTAIQKWTEQLLNIGQIAPGVLDVPKFDEIARGTSRLFGVDEKYVADEEEVAEKRSARQEQQEKAQMNEDISVGADALSKIGSLEGVV